jgi:hypothetical protein
MGPLLLRAIRQGVKTRTQKHILRRILLQLPEKSNAFLLFFLNKDEFL